MNGPVGLIPSPTLEEKRKAFVPSTNDYSKSSLCKSASVLLSLVLLGQVLVYRMESYAADHTRLREAKCRTWCFCVKVDEELCCKILLPCGLWKMMQSNLFPLP